MVIAVCVRSPEPSCQEGTGEWTAWKKSQTISSWSFLDSPATHREFSNTSAPLQASYVSQMYDVRTKMHLYSLKEAGGFCNLYNDMFKGPYLRTCVNTECLLKNQSSPTVSSTRPTGDDAMSVKQGFFLLNSKTCLFVQLKPASLAAVKFIEAILTQSKA